MDNEARPLSLLLVSDEGREAQNEAIGRILEAVADERQVVADRAEDLLARTRQHRGVIAELKPGAAALGELRHPAAVEALIQGATTPSTGSDPRQAGRSTSSGWSP